jgi:hypothetical protein
LSSLVSDLLGASARRMLKALAEGETNPAALAALADWKLRATPEQLCDALGACTDLKPVYRRLLKMALEQLQFLEQLIGQLDISNNADPVKYFLKKLLPLLLGAILFVPFISASTTTARS